MFARYVLVISLMTAFVGTAPEAGARTLQEILSSKKIRVGTVPYPPMTELDPKTGKFSGIWIDGPRFLFQQLGLEVEIVETKWATFASGLQSDQFDVFVGGSFATPKRAAVLDFTRPIMYMGHSVAVRKEDAAKYKSLADIDKKGIVVATVLGSSGHEYARENLKNATIKALDTGDLTQGALEVLAGRADVGLQDSFKISQVVRLHPDKLVNVFEANPFRLVFVSYAVAKGNSAFLQLLNTSLDWMESTGKWQEFAEPYGDKLSGVYFVKRDYRSFGGAAAGQ